MKKSINEIEDNLPLLYKMMNGLDMSSELYSPGPYWKNKNRSALIDIRKKGIKNFRFGNDHIGLSYTDSATTDLRELYNSGIKKLFGNVFKNTYPFKNLFNEQVKYTESYFELYLSALEQKLKNDENVSQLLNSFKLPSETLRGGCRFECELNKKKISVHYLENLNTLNFLSKFSSLPLSTVRNYFEIGGGFGSFTHCLLTNFPNIKKVIYLDIPPNLYIGTQYLRSFYGDAVKDYSETYNVENISFKNNDDLEIFCVLPMQIEKVNCVINYFHNDSSFVEMPDRIVRNYGKHINRLLDNQGMVSLLSYDNYREGITLNPVELPKLLELRGRINTTLYETILSGKKYAMTSSLG